MAISKSGRRLTVVSANSGASSSDGVKTNSAFQSRFNRELLPQLLLYQRFIGEWNTVITTWASKTCQPAMLFLPLTEILSEAMGSMQGYSVQLLSHVIHREGHQTWKWFRRTALSVYSNESGDQASAVFIHAEVQRLGKWDFSSEHGIADAESLTASSGTTRRIPERSTTSTRKNRQGAQRFRRIH
jgi:hypothetical protein